MIVSRLKEQAQRFGQWILKQRLDFGHRDYFQVEEQGLQLVSNFGGLILTHRENIVTDGMAETLVPTGIFSPDI